MANKSYRLMYRFWLDIEKPDEEAIANKIKDLKKERSFSSVVRDGIRLICDLRDGKLDVLFELFPFVRAEFLEYMRETLSIQTPQAVQETQASRADTQKSLEREYQKIEEVRKLLEAERQRNQTIIQKQLKRLEELLLQQDNKFIPENSGHSSEEPKISNDTGSQGVGLKGLSGKVAFTLPNFEDGDDEDFPELELKKAKGRGIIKLLESFANQAAQ